MPRSRKDTKWMISVEGQVLTNVRSKTYRGACFKAFKKLGVTPPKCKKERVTNYGNPLGIQYSYSFRNVYCIAQ